MLVRLDLQGPVGRQRDLPKIRTGHCERPFLLHVPLDPRLEPAGPIKAGRAVRPGMHGQLDRHGLPGQRRQIQLQRPTFVRGVVQFTLQFVIVGAGGNSEGDPVGPVRPQGALVHRNLGEEPHPAFGRQLDREACEGDAGPTGFDATGVGIRPPGHPGRMGKHRVAMALEVCTVGGCQRAGHLQRFSLEWTRAASGTVQHRGQVGHDRGSSPRADHRQLTPAYHGFGNQVLRHLGHVEYVRIARLVEIRVPMVGIETEQAALVVGSPAGDSARGFEFSDPGDRATDLLLAADKAAVGRTHGTSPVGGAEGEGHALGPRPLQVDLQTLLLPEGGLVEKLAGKADRLVNLRKGRLERGNHAPVLVRLVPRRVQLAAGGRGTAQVAVDDRVRPEQVRADRMRQFEPAPVPSTVDVVEPPGVTLSERLVTIRDLIEALAAQRYLRKRLTELPVQSDVALDHRHSINQAIVVIVDAKGLVEMQRVDFVVTA